MEFRTIREDEFDAFELALSNAFGDFEAADHEVASDRLSPRVVVVGTHLVEAAAAAALFGLAATGALELVHLYAYALVTAVAFAFFQPASMALLPDLLPRDQVRSGNALWAMAFNVARFAAPPGICATNPGHGPDQEGVAMECQRTGWLVSPINGSAS